LHTFYEFIVDGEHQISFAREEAKSIAKKFGFGNPKLEEIAIIVSELASNIHKYAGAGKIIIVPFVSANLKALDIYSVDHGPGIEDINRVLQDGYTTKTSLGIGLGAVKRMSDEFDIYSFFKDSLINKNITIIFSRKYLKDSEKHYKFAFLSRALKGEDYNGDALFLNIEGKKLTAALIDGIGHGEIAYTASYRAINYLIKNYEKNLDDILQDIDKELNHTFGAVASIIKIDKQKRKMIHAGVGNISARVLNAVNKINPISTNGYLGSNKIKIKTEEYDWSPNNIIIMTSDGIREKWNLSYYNELMAKHPAIIAQFIFQFFAKPNDDASIFVIT
jgi:anti-sigma regulatory factor (Ser/Thr protein kinase)